METDGHQWAPVMWVARWPRERVKISNCQVLFLESHSYRV